MQQFRSGDPTDILVVDDDSMIVEMLIDLLTFEGYAARGACNGREALDMITARRPAVLLLDLHMPVMDGAELIHTLSQTAFADLPIIIITALPADAQRIAHRHTVAWMTKPLDIDALLARLATALGGDG